MARVPNKHNRDQDLDWELSSKEKDKKLKAESREEEKVGSSSQRSGKIGGDKGTTKSAPSIEFLGNDERRNFDYSKSSGALNRISASFLTEESPPDAASEKELGNEYFKQKKFKEAIDCYSRSIALSPTAVAFANRAMAYLKIKRFQQAENDCTEALDLDDRYIKAYSRRATARKELGKFKESMEDADFALRLEPDNQELKKQYKEAKAMYDKELLEKASAAVKSSAGGMQKVVATASKENCIKEIETAENGSRRVEANGSREGPIQSSSAHSSKSSNVVNKKQEMKMSVQDLASRAASLAMAKTEKSVAPPQSAFQFEFSWRGLCGDPVLQACFLKAVPPSGLPQLFKTALSAPLLMDIIKCISTFFKEEPELAVKYLDSLTKVSRFDMLVMCLSAADKSDLHKMWEEVFSNEAVPIEYSETLILLQPKYCPRG